MIFSVASERIVRELGYEISVMRFQVENSDAFRLKYNNRNIFVFFFFYFPDDW